MFSHHRLLGGPDVGVSGGVSRLVLFFTESEESFAALLNTTSSGTYLVIRGYTDKISICSKLHSSARIVDG